MVTGYIDSIETMGLVDGPGVRFVVFLKGCKLRCLFCHNPETWSITDGVSITSDELIEKIKKYQNYYVNGGVTFSGGEPLLQSEFLIDMLKKCKECGIHTAIDTSGVGNGNYEEILKYCDLVILDIKAYRDEEYSYITGCNKKMDEFNKFLNICQKLNKKLWIRQVIVPGFNDTKEYILGLKEYLKDVKNIDKVELLPFHQLGKEKYDKLEITYPFKEVESMSNDKIDELRKLINEE